MAAPFRVRIYGAATPVDAEYFVRIEYPLVAVIPTSRYVPVTSELSR